MESQRCDILGHCLFKTCFCSPACMLFRGLVELVIIAIICIAHAQQCIQPVNFLYWTGNVRLYRKFMATKKKIIMGNDYRRYHASVDYWVHQKLVYNEQWPYKVIISVRGGQWKSISPPCLGWLSMLWSRLDATERVPTRALGLLLTTGTMSNLVDKQG